MRRAEIGFGGFEAWTEKVFEEEARNAERLDAKLRLEEHWLLRGVTARRKRNQGRLTKLLEMRAARAAMIGPAGTAKLGLQNDEVKTKVVIDADKVTKRFGERAIVRDFTLARAARRPDRRGRRERHRQDDPAQAAHRRDRAGRGHDPARADPGRDHDRPAAQAARSRQARRDILADGGDWIEVRGVKKHVQGYLKEFLFDPGLVDAKIGTLSGGERSRLLLAREFARRSNLLVLDEPTKRSRPGDARSPPGGDRGL
jgi:ATP-binding cassette subfamily F protein uup